MRMSLGRIETHDSPISELCRQAELLLPVEFSQQPELSNGAKLTYKVMGSSLFFLIHDAQYTVTDSSLYQSTDTLSLQQGSFACGSLGIHNNQVLESQHFGIATELRHRGLGQAYYRQLRQVARELGYKYICGYQATDSAVEFFITNGRFFLGEVKADKLKLFEQLGEEAMQTPDATFTVDVLNSDEVALLIKPNRVHITPATRLTERADQQEFSKTLRSLWRWTNIQSKNFPLGNSKAAELIQLFEEMNGMLPPEHRLSVLNNLRDRTLTVSTYYVLGDIVNFFSHKVWLFSELGRVLELKKRIVDLGMNIE
jgi:hypothetical protein